MSFHKVTPICNINGCNSWDVIDYGNQYDLHWREQQLYEALWILTWTLLSHNLFLDLSRHLPSILSLTLSLINSCISRVFTVRFIGDKVFLI
ncbi:hypothetical protein Y032_0060g3168 [Ancylostoma ceylanicum]|uniref:Uncharacterized protein n=1 Tax=Ancylostoma ceylanicum TaxID=53326 RepID=A0A016U4L1_9BILA|nr:hypothetical protein Y032_0060g3168 [Ancylostoma ceylanicum]